MNVEELKAAGYEWIMHEMLRKDKQLAARDKNIERLEKALHIATEYVRCESTRSSAGQLYDIEQARKGE